MTVLTAYLRTGRHHRRTPLPDRLVPAAAWLLEAGRVVRSACLIAALAALATSVLLVALPWRR